MEGQAVRRRISTITAHLLPSADEFSASHVLPMNCSSTLNSVIRRYDSKLYFARQGGASQSTFMRQGSIEEEATETENPTSQNNGNAVPGGWAHRRDSKLFFARQGSPHQAPFMRQICGHDEVLVAEADVAVVKSTAPEAEYSYYVSRERPSFSRPRTEPRFSAFQGCDMSVADPPKFAATSGVLSHSNKQCSNKKTHSSSSSHVTEWSPRMDVAESGRGYVVTVEIPGVNINDIRVEIDDKKLAVTGKRSLSGCSKNSASAYLRREIVDGPYSVIWPLPTNVNKDCVSAEFMDGFLRVVIPKL